jgi:hypothetical protein
MIVFDLHCSHGHVFEAWFGSSGDYEGQKARGLVSCPLCGDQAVDKAVMAPAVGIKGNRRSEKAPVAQGQNHNHNHGQVHTARDVATMAPEQAAELQKMIERVHAVQTKILENSQWVGDNFAEKARAMHYGDEPQSSIHGITDPQEARALIDEGVAIAPLPIPVVPPEERN